MQKYFVLIFYCTFHEILLLLIVEGGAINFDALHQLLYLSSLSLFWQAPPDYVWTRVIFASASRTMHMIKWRTKATTNGHVSLLECFRAILFHHNRYQSKFSELVPFILHEWSNLEVVCKGPMSRHVGIGSGNGLAPNRQQVNAPNRRHIFTWINGYLLQRRRCAGSELVKQSMVKWGSYILWVMGSLTLIPGGRRVIWQKHSTMKCTRSRHPVKLRESHYVQQRHMSAMASQFNGDSTVCSSKKTSKFAILALCTPEMFPWYDVIRRNTNTVKYGFNLIYNLIV